MNFSLPASRSKLFKSLINDKSQLEERLKELPLEPGCYMFRDISNRLLYVGKSKNLRNRVRSYFRLDSNLSPRINLMVRQISDIEFIVTDNEVEALNLESNLIKSKQPYFNVLLKDDKKYPYLCITWSDEYPRIFITRRRIYSNKKDRYYGPFVDVGLLRKTLSLIKRVFPLRQRPRPMYKDRTCLNYSIGRCPGVCQKQISSNDYHTTLKKVSMVFQGRSDELRSMLTEQMNDYSEKQRYESAAIIRDQIKGLDQLSQDQKLTLSDSNVNRDVIAMSYNDNVASVQIFQMRSGKTVGRLGFIADSFKREKSVVLQMVIEEHYSVVDPVEIPPELVVQYSLPQEEYVREWLSELRRRNVVIYCPKRSHKLELVNLVKRNADFELARIKRGIEKQSLAIEDLAQLLELNYPPRRIEGYDISHIQGSDAVGSQVVFIDGVPAKQHYRKYKIKTDQIYTGHSNDYLALSEVIKRRFRRWSRLKKEHGDLTSFKTKVRSALDIKIINDWPDLVMIDGGKGQLSSVMKVLKELDLHEEVSICSLAKKKEEVFVPGQSKALNTLEDQIGILLLRQLRDEAHRFAINYHRQRRTERMKKSHLADIPNLGPKRRHDLLLHFHSVDAIKLATYDQLLTVPGLGKASAKEIWNYFHSEENI